MGRFVERFDCDLYGEGRPMQAATNGDGLSIINFGIGSSNAATVMDLLSAREPRRSKRRQGGAAIEETRKRRVVRRRRVVLFPWADSSVKRRDDPF